MKNSKALIFFYPLIKNKNKLWNLWLNFFPVKLRTKKENIWSFRSFKPFGLKLQKNKDIKLCKLRIKKLNFETEGLEYMCSRQNQ